MRDVQSRRWPDGDGGRNANAVIVGDVVQPWEPQRVQHHRTATELCAKCLDASTYDDDGDDRHKNEAIAVYRRHHRRYRRHRRRCRYGACVG